MFPGLRSRPQFQEFPRNVSGPAQLEHSFILLGIGFGSWPPLYGIARELKEGEMLDTVYNYYTEDLAFI